ncbi:MAG: hypothetical protein ACTSQJ_02995 [Promethearchaeota archaeon]
MTDKHYYSFFGQNTGLIVKSFSPEESYMFFKCIKRKPDGIWEKPSTGEGKIIRCSLEEIVMILQVLNGKLLNWTSYHVYKGIKTQISFGWEDEKKATLWINIANYSKMLNFAQVEVLRLLLSHLLKEKIKYATIINKNSNINKRKNNMPEKIRPNPNNYLYITQNSDGMLEDNLIEEINDNYDMKIQINSSNFKKNGKITQNKSNLKGIIIEETEKALLIRIQSGREFWLPKSTIHSNYLSKKNIDQNFLIDDWVLKRNKILS